MHYFKNLNLPNWITQLSASAPRVINTLEEQMDFVIELSRENVVKKTGGPFGAAVFEISTGKLVSVGVNTVTAINCSIAHAEIMAITMAQESLQNYDLGCGETAHRLVTSARVCAMCFGAIFWSGIRELAYAATSDDVEKITGFDEGPLHPHWENELTKRGIKVFHEIEREKAVDVLKFYKESGGIIYNSRNSKPA